MRGGNTNPHETGGCRAYLAPAEPYNVNPKLQLKLQVLCIKLDRRRRECYTRWDYCWPADLTETFLAVYNKTTRSAGSPTHRGHVSRTDHYRDRAGL